MTRAHVRLLGPCFKTGRTGYRPIRHRRRVRRQDTRPLNDRSRRTLTTVSPSRSTEQRRGETPTASGLPRSADGPTQSGSITPTPKRWPPSPNASDRRQTGRGARRADSAPAAARNRRTETPARRCPRRDDRTADRLNPTRRLCGPLRLPLNGFTYC
jgi:hypothetical protein